MLYGLLASKSCLTDMERQDRLRQKGHLLGKGSQGNLARKNSQGKQAGKKQGKVQLEEGTSSEGEGSKGNMQKERQREERTKEDKRRLAEGKVAGKQ